MSKKIGTIPFTDSNGIKHYLAVEEDGRVVLPDGSVRKIRKEIMDKLLTQQRNQEATEIAKRSDERRRDVRDGGADSHAAAENAQHGNSLEEQSNLHPESNRKTDAVNTESEPKNTIVPDSEDTNDKASVCQSNDSGNQTAGKEKLEESYADPDVDARGEGVAKSKESDSKLDSAETNHKKQSKQKSVKRIVVIALAIIFAISALSAVGLQIYRRGGIFNDVLKMVDSSGNAVDTDGVMRIDYYAVITDSNGVQHEVKLSSLTLSDRELIAMVDSSGQSMLK